MPRNKKEREICPYCGHLAILYAEVRGINTYWECAKCQKDPDGKRVKKSRYDH
jgi:ribosomal protein L37AE/L43A